MRGLCIITFIFCFLSEVIYGAACSGRTTYSAMGASGAFTTIGSGSGPGMVRLCVEGNTFSGGMCSTNDAGIYIYDCSLTNIYGIINENTPVGYCMSMNICDGCMNLRKICSGNSGDITLSWSTVKDGASLCTGPNTVAAYISVPSADCLGAIYISQDGTYPSIASGEGFEEFMCAGINGTTNGGCLTAQSSLNNFAGGEHNSRWYRFVPQTSGTLTIDIAPSAYRDDYDFALWQSDDCNNLGTPLRCNYCDGNGSTGIGPTGVLPSTPVSVGCNNYSSTLNVTAGLTYYLLVNGFGFPLDPTFNITFGGTTSLKPSVLCPNLEINSTIENTTCGSANGSINLSPIEVGQYYNYRWNNGSTFQNLKYIGPGTYTVSVSPTNNPQCPTIKTFTVQGSSNTLVSSINGNLSICQGGSSNITATGGVLYTWNNGTSGPVLNVSSSGNYIVTVTNSQGCQSVSSFDCSIIEVSANISGENTICKGDTISLVASGGGIYSWNTGSSEQNLNVSSSGNYNVTVTNSLGCKSVTSHFCTIIEVSANISGENTICKGDTIFLFASGGGTYNWNTGSIDSITNITTGGHYFLTVTNNGCISLTEFLVTELTNNCTTTTHSEAILLGNSNFVKIYPNPATNSIKFELLKKTIKGVKIIDNLGKISISSKEISREDNSISVDITFLPKGIYYALINSENELFNARFIKIE